MPRLTNSDYYKRHKFLRHVWLNYENCYGALSWAEQHCLHECYKPNEEYSKAEAVAHRQAISRQDPGLPARASKFYSKLHQVYEREVVQGIGPWAPKADPAQFKRKKGKRGPIKLEVRPIARPEIDWDKYARTTLEYARQILAGEAEPPSFINMDDYKIEKKQP